MPAKRLSIAVGTVGQSVAVIAAIFLGAVSSYFSFLLALVVSIIAWGLIWFFSHCLAHYVVGRLLGIGFDYYFVGRSAMRHLKLPLLARLGNAVPTLGIKTNRKSMDATKPQAKAAMFRAGALVSMLLPFTVPLISFLSGRLTVAAILLALSVANLTFTMYFSPRAGDFHRAANALKAVKR